MLNRKMDSDKFSFIFGSFSRRRHSQDISTVKRRSSNQSKSSLNIHQKPVQNVAPIIIPTTSAIKINTVRHTLPAHKLPSLQSINSDTQIASQICSICNKYFSDPRVLPCLHTFCSNCLQELITKFPWNKEIDGVNRTKFSSESESSSASGYESEKRDASSSSDSWSPKVKHKIRNESESPSLMIVCPLCQSIHILPSTGVTGFPPNLILKRMIKKVSQENLDTIQVLCDFCSFDTEAIAYCKTCMKHFCKLCCNSHKRQRSTSRHEIIYVNAYDKNLKSEKKCPLHTDQNLHLLCITCHQIICQICRIESHRDHNYELASKMVQVYTGTIQDALDRARTAAEQATEALDHLDDLSQKIQDRSNTVHVEVDRFIELYKKALEEHKSTLFTQVRKSREDKLQTVNIQRSSLQTNVDLAKNTITFVEDLLSKGTDEELIVFIVPILEKLEWCSEIGRHNEHRVTECIQFLPDEKVPGFGADSIPLYGMITTQTIAAENCTVINDGLQNLRIHRKTDILVETRDIDNHRLCHGGELLVVEAKYCNANNRSLHVTVTDLRDGTYSLSINPDTAGQLTLSILAQGKHIRGSPFTEVVRTVRAHYGVYHCCTFCSSGGNKQATCGCGGKMPGNYKGCGHGHEGHPGKRHWSCCGSLFEHSECTAISASYYQFTL